MDTSASARRAVRRALDWSPIGRLGARPDKLTNGPGSTQRPGSTEGRPQVEAGAQGDKGDRHPHVLIVGGYLTQPLSYGPLRRRLLARGAASVTIAPVHIPDWLAAAMVGFGPLLLRTGLAVRRVHRAAGDTPIIVVGHSAGGLLSRLAMSDIPFRGRRMAVSDRVGALVTLGTPHELAQQPFSFAHAGIEAAAFLSRHAPGARFAPRTAYVTVGSDLVRPTVAPARHLWDRLLGALFRFAVGPTTDAGGDGIVQLSAVHLSGARQLSFHDVRHGHFGSPWYGDDEVVDRWWPVAVELWREALAVREGAGAGAPRRSSPSVDHTPVTPMAPVPIAPGNDIG